jgi:prepilin-type N-terminal cleavage/methylation domain-containing protein
MMRRGSTLVELIVTLAVMAVVASVVALSTRSAPASRQPDFRSTLAAARQQALDGRAPVTIEVRVNGRAQSATFFPDGSAVGDSTLRLNRLTGAVEPTRAR